ncbi:hypothetical protein M407DRAFT_6593 [Tulasnella calospora MUT 4182]|uniref:Pentacotripeptide-repeat region of PRORP domain-containing protein n=1 Tax=Tulasnella calospora MUT 4182 TaxID=1051891 RepID=A0A0C3QD75_9AGAM|nr:hypothetical protein M407DRAFT_6593 [Tulasnella calospora MUT 4182]
MRRFCRTATSYSPRWTAVRPRPSLQAHPTPPHSTRQFNIFSLFNRGDLSAPYKTQSLSSAHSAWIQALNTGRVKDIKQTYTFLTNWISSASPLDASTSTSLPSETDVLRMLEVVADTSNPDVSFIRTVLSHSSQVLGRPLSQDYYALLAKALVACGDGQQALSTLVDAAQRNVDLDAAAWEPLVACSAQLRDRVGLHAAKEHMKACGVVPTPAAYRHLLDFAFEENIDLDVKIREGLEPLKAEMEANGVLTKPTILSCLLNGYSSIGEPEEAARWAKEIQNIIAARPDWGEPEPEELEMLEALVTFTERRFGDIHVKNILTELLSRGFVPSSSILSAILHGKGLDANAASLLALQEEIGVAAGPDAWAILIANALNKGGLPSAMGIYNQATTILAPSVVLCQAIFGVREYMLPDGRTLYDIYQDLLLAESTTLKSAPNSATHVCKLYEDLLLAMAAQHDRLLVPKQLSLLVDMRNRSISFDVPTTVAVLRQLMRSSGSYNAAYNLYSNVRSLGSSFTQATYQEALQILANMRVERRASANFPPSRLFFSIVKDMSDDGFPVGAETFSMLFARLRHAAVRVQYSELGAAENPNHELLAEVRRAHVLFRLYAAVTPDTSFLNLLMDTYSRIGGFSEAWSIWEEDLFPPKIHDGKSISIILDTCGHYRATKEAFVVWKAIKEWEWRGPQNQIAPKLWETWIECLCRLDLVDDVRRTLVRELGTPATRASSDAPAWRLHATERMASIAVNFKWRGPGSEAKKALVYSTAKRLLSNLD